MRHSLVFLPSYKDSIRPLDDQTRLLMYDALVDYAVDGIEPNLPPLLNALFLSFKPIIDNGIKKYDAAVGNGKKGGRPRKEKTGEKPVKNQNLNQEEEKEVEIEKEVEVDVEKEVDVEEEKDIGSAGPDSRSRPYKEVDVDKEKLSLSRFMPPEGLRDATPEEIEENNQKKVLALQKLRQEVNK